MDEFDHLIGGACRRAVPGSDELKIYSWLLGAAVVGSVLCTIVVNPTGEGFVRGYNVLFAFFISSSVVWIMALPAIVYLLVRWVKTKNFKAAMKQEWPIVILVAAAALIPLINGFLIRIKSALGYI